jgi:hypothetical protein
MDYDRPINGAFTAMSSLADAAAWPAFVKTLARKQRAQIEVRSSLIHQGATVGELTGKFVAFLREAA